MDSVRTLEKLVVKLLEGIITFFFAVILLTTISLVILRYVFNSGIYGGNELISYLFIYTTALGASLSIGSNEHIRISFAVDLFPKPIKKVADVLGLVLIAFLNTAMIFMSIPWIRKVGSFESPTLRIPNGWVHFSIPLGCGFAVIFCIFRLIHLLREEETDASSSD